MLQFFIHAYRTINCSQFRKNDFRPGYFTGRNIATGNLEGGIRKNICKSISVFQFPVAHETVVTRGALQVDAQEDLRDGNADEVFANLARAHSSIEGLLRPLTIVAGKGGVGKSTVTSNLAVALAREGAKVGLIDADIFGPSIPTMFNCEHEQPHVKQVNGKNIIIPLEQYGVKLLSIGFLTPPDSAVVWRGPMLHKALQQFLNDVHWDEPDYLLIDLPPGTGDVSISIAQFLPGASMVIVVPDAVHSVDRPSDRVSRQICLRPCG